MPTWFDKNPNPTGGYRGVIGSLQWGAHVFGRQQFASNYARGGMASTIFAPTPGQAFRSAWGSKAPEGGIEHVQNLRRLQRLHPDSSKIRNALSKAEKTAGGAGRGVLGRVAGVGMAGAFLAMPAFATPGGPKEKLRGVTKGAAGWIGWEVGAKLGMGTGAAAGMMAAGPLGAAVGGMAGYVIGGMAGALGAEELTDVVTRAPDRLVERERKKRRLNWVHDQRAFQTQNAATMRQMSLQAMNRGMATARSAMGREAIMLHR